METMKMKNRNVPSRQQTENAQRFISVIETVTDKEQRRALAIISAFMDGMATQRLLEEE